MKVLVKSSLLRVAGVATAALIATSFAAPRPAAADSGSTAAIAAGAAVILGGLLYDSHNRPYYNHGGHRQYVSDREAQSYRQRGGRYRDNGGQWHQDHGGSNHGDHGGH